MSYPVCVRCGETEYPVEDGFEGACNYCVLLVMRLIPPPSDPLAVARCFVARCYPRVRVGGGDMKLPVLVHWRDDFLAWDGHWQARDLAAIRSELYGWLETQRYRLPDDDDGRMRAEAWIPNTHRVNQVMDALTAVCYLPSDIEEDSFLGPGNDGNGYLLIVASSRQDQNSISRAHNRKVTVTTVTSVPMILDITSGILEPATPAWFSQHRLDFGYDPGAGCPGWTKFLQAVWPDDTDSIRLLQEWFGYVIAGENRAQKMMLLIGPKRGGKGTIAGILRLLVGTRYHAGPTLASLCEPFGLQGLIGKRLAVIADARLRAGAKDVSVAVSRLLMITGGDVLDVARKNKTDWTGLMPVRFMILSNETPRLSDASSTIASRFLSLQLTRSWYGQEDLQLGDRLAGELPGILNWAIRGYRRLADNKFRFTCPESAEDIESDLEALASPVKTFAADCCDVDPLLWAFADEIYAYWRAWCSDNGVIPGPSNVFSRDLRAATDNLLGTRTGTNPRTGRRAKIITGIGISPEANISPEQLWIIRNGEQR